MLKFYPLDTEGLCDILAPCRDGEVLEDLLSILSAAGSLSDCGMEVKVAQFLGAVVIMVFDGEEYSFSYPIPLLDGVPGERVLCALADFTVRELIPLKLFDVPRGELDLLCEVFPHVDGYADPEDEDIFSAYVRSELSLCEEHPSFADVRLTLDELKDTDAEGYYALLSDREVNRYWGYDFRDDYPGADGADLIREARSEYSRGVAVSFAVRLDGFFIGEAVLHSFDLRGGCQAAIRLDRFYHGCGLGSQTFFALEKICRDMGIARMLARVDGRNAPSLKMCRRYMTELEARDGIVGFERILK